MYKAPENSHDAEELAGTDVTEGADVNIERRETCTSSTRVVEMWQLQCCGLTCNAIILLRLDIRQCIMLAVDSVGD
jgi:hypothetical protein